MEEEKKGHVPEDDVINLVSEDEEENKGHVPEDDVINLVSEDETDLEEEIEYVVYYNDYEEASSIEDVVITGEIFAVEQITLTDDNAQLDPMTTPDPEQSVPMSSHSTNSFHKSSQQEQLMDQGAEPSKLLKQTLTTDDRPRRSGRSSVQPNMELLRRSTESKNMSEKCCETAQKIEVPGWSTDPDWEEKFGNLPQMSRGNADEEMLEDTSDKTFARRHEKLERKERKLIKADRKYSEKEEKRKEKLKRKEKITEKQHLYHDPRNIREIEILVEIPVIAFGEVIPEFEQRNFNIPKEWVEESEWIASKKKKAKCEECFVLVHRLSEEEIKLAEKGYCHLTSFADLQKA